MASTCLYPAGVLYWVSEVLAFSGWRLRSLVQDVNTLVSARASTVNRCDIRNGRTTAIVEEGFMVAFGESGSAGAGESVADGQ